MLCRHCNRRPSNRPRGLCWTCYYTPGLRDQYPSTSKFGRRGVELTAAGESLLDHARVVIHQIDAMRGDLAGFASGVRASVHFLANTSGLSEHLPKALAGFLREHRDVAIDIE